MIGDPFTFEAESHTYRLGSQRLPSVTEILSPVIDYSMVPPDVLAAAAEFGTHVHLATHLADTGELDPVTLDAALVPYVRAWARYVDDSGAVVLQSEVPFVHRQLGYAGTPDRIVSVRGKRVIVDIKSTATLPPSVGPQTSAYAAADAHMRGTKRQAARLSVHLRPDGTYRAVPLNDPSDWSTFLSCLNIRRFLERHNAA